MLNVFQKMHGGPRATRSRQSGLSLVELMVGMVVGMVVVAAAAMVTSAQLSDSRRLLVETQLQQDLRAATDIITRELRRAGSYAATDLARNSVWNPAAAGTTLTANPFSTVTVTAGTNSVEYAYYRSAASLGPYGFRLSNGVVQSRIDGGNVWQDLTDNRVMTVDSFDITENSNVPAFKLPCPKDCPSGAFDSCWPTVRVRELELVINGHHPTDTSITRSIRTVVRLRNDLLAYSLSSVCPA